MGYSEDEFMVRVDFFKSSGKWYCTRAVKWTGSWAVKESDNAWDIHEQFAKSLRDHFKYCFYNLSDMDAICIEPYHEHSHPIQLKAGSWNK